MKNNKGFTLVELIVVIALMAIIAGVSSYTISTVSNQELKDFANNYDAMLSQCQIETMSGMRNPVLEIAVNRDGEYRATLYSTTTRNDGSTVREVVKSQYLGEDYLVCKYDETTLARTDTLTVQFDRSTGEITTNKGFKTISVSNGRGTYKVQLVPETGFHKVTQ